jgi:hypothetical protein
MVDVLLAVQPEYLLEALHLRRRCLRVPRIKKTKFERSSKQPTDDSAICARPLALSGDFFRGSVPRDRTLPEVRLIGHVAGQRSVVAEYHILDNRLAGAYGLKEIP